MGFAVHLLSKTGNMWVRQSLGRDTDSSGWEQAVWTHLLLPSPPHPSLLDWEQRSPGIGVL